VFIISGIKRTSEEWLELVKTQRASGLTMKAWCATNGVNLYTMADRASKLRKDGLLLDPRPNRGGKPSRQSDWIELNLRGGTALHPLNESLPGSIEIRIGSFIVTVPENFNEAAFIRICKALMALC